MGTSLTRSDGYQQSRKKHTEVKLKIKDLFGGDFALNNSRQRGALLEGNRLMDC